MMSPFFLRDENDLQCVLSLTGEFSLFSYLEININQTEAMWLGSKKQQQSAETHFDLRWKPQLKISGILFNNNMPASCIEKNWTRR